MNGMDTEETITRITFSFQILGFKEIDMVDRLN